ncbi:DUF4097 domain-containing protein [Paenibacillus sp. NPDC058071]|uniref:DUF4097 family beta strand repeat-containing protein n=1 Tax=Paenibacillus sp. NPDC058071 TaxID=3346326 RepID=UPI0036DE1B55
MGEFGMNRPKSRTIAVLFAFLLPGAGHLYTGHYLRGLLLMAGLLLDYTAIIHLADANGARHLLLIVYLAMALPVFYFYSVYDALQSIERQPGKGTARGVAGGLLVMAAGAVLLILIAPPDALRPWMNELAEYAVGPLLALLAIIRWILGRKGAVEVFKLGRYTSAVIVITVGALLLSDQIQGRNDIALLMQWWPAAFILLGAEIIGYSVVQRRHARRLRLDFGGAMLAFIIAGSAIVITQFAELPFRWLDQYVDLNGTADYSGETGFRYEKEPVRFVLDEGVTDIRVQNANGNVAVRTGESEQAIIESEVWVDLPEEAEAARVAERSKVEVNVSEAGKVSVHGKGEPFGTSGGRSPRINLTIILPKKAVDEGQLPPEEGTADFGPSETPGSGSQINDPNEADEVDEANDANDANEATDEAPANTKTLRIEVSNGTVDVEGVDAGGGLVVKTANGNIKADVINGPVDLSASSGEVFAKAVTGATVLSAKNGAIRAADIEGALTASTINGSIELKRVSGAIEAETKNGKIRIEEAGSSVKADTLNGEIELDSSVVAGDWDIDSSVGEIRLNIPFQGNFSVYGSVTFGSITTDFPFTTSKKTVRGTVGEGTYRILINAANSISIKQKGL